PASTPEGAPAPALGERSGAPSGFCPASIVISKPPVAVQLPQPDVSANRDAPHKKIVNMLADDTAAPAAARTLAKAAEQEGKLISDYLTERLQHDHAPPTSAWDKMKAAAAEARERRQAKEEKFVPTEPRPTYKEPREVTAMVLACKDQIKFLERLKLVAKAMKGLPPDTYFAQALAAALTEGARALKGTAWRLGV